MARAGGRLIWLAMKWLFGLLFVLAGVAHFVRPGIYLKIMPPYLPWHLELVYLSGLFEILLGVLFLIPRFTAPADRGVPRQPPHGPEPGSLPRNQPRPPLAPPAAPGRAHCMGLRVHAMTSGAAP